MIRKHTFLQLCTHLEVIGADLATHTGSSLCMVTQKSLIGHLMFTALISDIGTNDGL